ncbi:MAG: DUF4330 domain-containing protein [Eubacteriales bacterium]|nr:DUF4330 domain-containing protein [Eubacteriales bacterium]
MKKFNWIDLAVILLIVAIAFGGVWFLKGRQTTQKASTNTVDIYVTVEMDGLTEVAAKEYEKSVGQAVTLGAKSADKGTLHKVEYTKSKKDVGNFGNGTYVTVEYEDMYTAYVTLKVSGTETETLISSTNEEYHIGEKLIFHGKGFAGEGYMTGLSTEKEAK